MSTSITTLISYKRIVQSSVTEGEGKDICMSQTAEIVKALADAIKSLQREEKMRDSLSQLREEIAPLAAQIISPKDNTLSRQLALIDSMLLDMEDEVAE